MSLKKLLFVGMPGAGKSTQAAKLVHYGFKPVNTGKIIRKALKKGDPIIGSYTQEEHDRGIFLSDERIYDIVEREIKDLQFRGYVLDGAIRTTSQAGEGLEREWIEGVILFNLTEKEAVRRLTERYKSGGRKDDDAKVIPERIQTYRKETEPIIDYLNDRGFYIHGINAHLSVEEIHKKVLEILELR